MATTLITTSSFTTGLAWTPAAAGDGLYVARGVTWGSSDANIVSSSLYNLQIDILGDVVGDPGGIVLSGTDNNVRIGQSGTFTGLLDSHVSAAIYFGDGGILRNEGEIHAPDAIAVATNDDSSIINTGTISGLGGGVFMNAFNGADGSLVNSGTISTAGLITDAGPRYLNAVFSEGPGAYIVNEATGVIAARAQGGVGDTPAGIRFADNATGSEVINHGSVSAAYGFGVDFSDVTIGDDVRLTNTGMISGELGAFTGSDRSETLVNTGSMIGDVLMENGADILVQNGLVDGNVSLGAGDDVYNGRGGLVTGLVNLGSEDDLARIDDPDLVIHGGLGNDTLLAWDDVLNATGFEEISLRGSADATVSADDSTVALNGNTGDNTLYGSTIGNNIKGFGGDDEIYGFAGADTIRGNTGNDLIDGGADADVIFGGTGDDTIIGGTGADVMRGEQGADTFVWNGINEAGTGSARDVVIGFERGTDVMDLVGIGDTSFTFLGTGAFTGGGVAELRYRVQTSGHSIVELDSNGDGIVDAEIQVRGVTTLDAGDFVL